MLQLNGAAPTQRVVLLGASNLTRGISTVVETAHGIWGRPIEILTALGHGRSYGLESRMLGRRLPGIVQCGLWNVLASGPKTLTSALITDIGNDILYGVEVPQIIAWVTVAIDRLQAVDARISLTRLPLAGIERLGSARYLLFRHLLFPNCRMSLDVVRRRAIELDERLERLGQSRQVHLVEHESGWYGFDPVHIRLRHWRRAWPQLLSAPDPNSNGAATFVTPRGSLSRWLYLRTRRPLERHLLGVHERCAQPSARLSDGTMVSFF